ncbi:MAG: HD domain-containing protein [Candidatus Odinarchaeum yellowstonii]|uniref:HD domain-containing protein n=1 Tax=Odinarchaeota yellowstonii (strain LCB_4) TaxID=1841599 RepID=A0AAF0D2I7_ODILC|nr:MAG: HD domain-containing protein [Candidatus Odinarchaeum yellowstonii]
MKFEIDREFFSRILSKKGFAILESLLNDKDIKEIYEIGDLMARLERETPHDYSHAVRAVSICAELIKLIQRTRLSVEVYKLLDKKSMNLALLTASYLHDIGNFVNREEHALAGAMLAFNILDKYLKDLDHGNLIKSIVCHAVAEHSPRKVLPSTAYSSIVALSDKLDISHMRVSGYKPSTFKEYSTGDVLNIELKRARGKIIIEVTISHPSGLYRVENLRNYLNIYDLINRYFEVTVKNTF